MGMVRPVMVVPQPGHEEGMRGRSRWIGLAAVAIIVASGVLGWLARSPAIETRQDDAAYVVLAESLRDGHYRESWQVEGPFHARYPPGYPAVLATWTGLFGSSHDTMVTLNLLFLLGTLAFAFVGARRVFGDGAALAGLGVVACNPYLHQYTGEVSSEPLYTVLTLAALAGLVVAKPDRWRLVAIGGAAIVATMSRSIGVALLAAILVHWALERRWRGALWFAAACAATVGAWLLWTALAPPESATEGYVTAIVGPVRESFFGRVLLRPMRLAVRFGSSVLPWALAIPTVAGTWVDNLIAVALMGGGLATGLVVLWQKWRPAAIYLVLYGGILLLWWAAPRLLVPLLPLLVPAIVGGLYVLGRRFSRPLGVALAAAFALPVAANGVVMSLQQVRERVACERVEGIPTGGCLTEDQESYFQALRHIRSKTPPDARVYTAKPEPLFLYAQRKTPPRSVVWSTGFAGELESYGVSYLLAGALHTSEQNRLPEQLGELCDRLTVEAFFPPRTYLFRLWERPPAQGTEEACAAVERYREANADLTFR